MQIATEKENSKLTLTVSGRIDTVTAPELEKFALEHMEGITEMVLDLADVEYVSSAGLRALLQINKDMSKQGKLKLLNIRPSAKEIFDMVGFSRIFTIE
ncbi:MAG: STAS domain-containing protein [Eubacterium sp.]|nr:STAS domain-containing protein [Eubacterium sp.]